MDTALLLGCSIGLIVGGLMGLLLTFIKRKTMPHPKRSIIISAVALVAGIAIILAVIKL